MPIRVDFSHVDDFDPLPIGPYKVEIEDVETLQAEGKEFPYLKWTLVVVDDETYQGRKVFANTSLAPKAAFKLKEALIAFGENEEEMGGQFAFEPEDYIGNRCMAVIGHREYDGKTYDDVKSLQPDNRSRRSGGAKERMKIR